MTSAKEDFGGVSSPEPVDNVRTALRPGTLARAILENLYYVQGRIPRVATPNDWYMALSYTVRDRLLGRWFKTVGNFSKTRYRGLAVNQLAAHMLGAAYNLLRIAKLIQVGA